jgi:hypothetical protein
MRHALGKQMRLTLLGALALGLSGTAHAAGEPCDGLRLDGGQVTTAQRLPAVATPDGAVAACVKAVGKALRDRRARAVTISVKLTDSARGRGDGPKVGTAYTRLLTDGGLPEARISVVIPAADADAAGVVSLAYTERRARRPVAVLSEASGVVKAGARMEKLEAIQRGAEFRPGTFVVTARDARASLQLADGSKLKLAPNTAVSLGKLHLNKDLKRVVKLELLQGDVEAQVARGGEGAVFEIETASGVAGVRGTDFKLGSGKETNLSTLDGSVALKSDKGEVVVPRGQRSSVAAGQAPAPPTALLDPPVVSGPYKGKLPGDRTLGWGSVGGADGYQVELARDAEFIYGVRAVRSDGTQLVVPKDLPGGKWFWRVSGLDGDGYGGQTSKVYAFEL